MPSQTIPYGRRLVPDLIDEYARRDPPQAWASIPIDNENISAGFRELSFKEFARAVDKASWWLDNELGLADQTFPAFAYIGINDLRYAVLQVAAAKTRRRVLMLSLLAAPAAQVHMLTSSDCKVLLYAEPVGPVAHRLGESDPNPKILLVPEFDFWFAEDEVSPYIYSNRFEDAKRDPWVLFHTSGTTGMPKLVSITHEIVASVDNLRLLPTVDGQDVVQWSMDCQRAYSVFPFFHVASRTTNPSQETHSHLLQLSGFVISIVYPIFGGTVGVFGPPTQPPSAALADRVLRLADADAAWVSASIVSDLVRDPSYHDTLRRLKTVCFCGAPLDKKSGDFFISLKSLRSYIGQTESGIWPTLVPDPEDWEYSWFHPEAGVRFEPRMPEEGLYELVFQRSPERESWTYIFKLYPHVGEFYTRDLMSQHPHPDKKHLWRYRGRVDDLIPLTRGLKIHATGLEEQITLDPLVRSALVGGYGRPLPFVLIEVAGQAPGSMEESVAVRDSIWPTIAKINKRLPESTRIPRDLVLVVPHGKPFLRLGKGCVDRAGTTKAFQAEVETLYERHDCIVQFSKCRWP